MNISFQTVENFVVILIAALIVGILIYRLFIGIEVKNVIEENEVSLNRKMIYARILLSSPDIAYTDEGGVHKGVIDYQTDKVKKLSAKDLFDKHKYQPDGISSKGYFHYVRIVDLEPKTQSTPETIREKEFIQAGLSSSAARTNQLSFDTNIRYAPNDIRLGKLYVNIIPV